MGVNNIALRVMKQIAGVVLLLLLKMDVWISCT